MLEALAVGLPAVLPPVFRDTFGPAALYAEPDEVWPTISKLWASEADWLAQGAAAQAFVRAGSDWSVFRPASPPPWPRPRSGKRTLGTGIGAETGAKAESEGGPRETGAAAADAVAVHA